MQISRSAAYRITLRDFLAGPMLLGRSVFTAPYVLGLIVLPLLLMFLRELLGGLDTLFLPTREPFVYLSSSLVRDIASHGGDIAPFVPDGVAQEVAQAYRMAAPPPTVTGIEKNDPINKGETT